jgi:hypothetical protein
MKANVPDSLHEALSDPANVLEFAKQMRDFGKPVTLKQFDPQNQTISLPVPNTNKTVEVRVLTNRDIKFNF